LSAYPDDEKELPVPEERPLVQSTTTVYRRIVAAASDPSVIYVELPKGRTRAALPSSGYADKFFLQHLPSSGLPPGPIAKSGKTSLEAALHPATSDYYYFVE